MKNGNTTARPRTRHAAGTHPKSADHSLRGRWRKVSRGARWTLLIVACLLLAARLALPSVVRNYVNRQLDRSPDYAGQIGEVDLHLWRGAYKIQNIEIFKRSGRIRHPFFAANQLDLSIEWKELIHGSVVGEVVMQRPRLNFVSGPTPEETQTGTNAPWGKIMESLFPFKINRFEIHDGQVHFANEHSTPPVDIYLNELTAVATNLTNTRDLKTELPAGVKATGKALGTGRMTLDVRLNPLAASPAYEMTCQLTNVQLTALNDFLRAYGKFDVEHGVFALFTSVASKDGSYDGYLKVFFDDLNVFEWEKERKKNALEVFWQAIVGTLATMLKNQPNDRLATRIPISGSYQDSHVGVFSAIGTLLRNAFVRALVPKLDEKVTVAKVEKENQPESKANRTGKPSHLDQKGGEALITP